MLYTFHMNLDLNLVTSLNVRTFKTIPGYGFVHYEKKPMHVKRKQENES